MCGNVFLCCDGVSGRLCSETLVLACGFDFHPQPENAFGGTALNQQIPRLQITAYVFALQLAALLAQVVRLSVEDG